MVNTQARAPLVKESAWPHWPMSSGSGSLVSWVLEFVLSNKNHFFFSLFVMFVVVGKYEFVITHRFSVSLSTA